MAQEDQSTLIQTLDYSQNSIEFESNSTDQIAVLNIYDRSDSFADNTLVELHKAYGNRWKKISSHFQYKDDSFIKNHFYSLLRKALRKINSYLKIQNKFQNTNKKLLKLNFVFKLANLAELERHGFSNNKYYTSLLYEFLSLGNENLQRINFGQGIIIGNYFERIENQEVQKLVRALRKVQIFFLINNLNKKGKSKKKCPKKLMLKKDQIKKSIDQLEMKEDQKTIGFFINDFLSPMPTEYLSQEKQEEMRSFDLQASYQNISNNIMLQENNFDPTLFN